MKIFKTLQHCVSWVLDLFIPRAETVAKDIEAVVGSEAAQSILEIAGKANWQPKFVSVVGSIVHGIAAGAKDGEDFRDAVAALGLNPFLDERAFADLEQIYGALKGIFAGKKMTVPVSQAISIK